MDWTLALLIIAASFLTAFAALLGISMLPSFARMQWLRPADPESDDTVFLFDQERLIDATPNARRFLARGSEDLDDWHRLAALLAPRFPDFREKMSTLAETGIAVIEELAGPAIIRARWIGGVARITLFDRDLTKVPSAIDANSLAALNTELETLRSIATHTPALTWRQNGDGVVTWANKAYLRLAEHTLEEDESLVWPLPRLFDPEDLPGAAEDMAPRRVSLRIPGKGKQWFDCSAMTDEEGRMFFALPADATVRAEKSLHSFVQTLTKTFADLPIGLAIFNRSRQLVLFNPALTDLCTLETEFLIARPTLFGFLDRLREKQMIPEPKDYKGWRKRMTELEADAANGQFQETWTLPSGQTYRVTGRPHPGGAVAFLFEDISTEISLTRRFRADMEQSQAVLDSLDEAIAVFSTAGTLTVSNTAYAALWGQDPSCRLGECTMGEATALWASRSASNAVWAWVREYVATLGPREEQRHAFLMSDGTRMMCRVRAISGGATMVGFCRADSVPTRAPAQTVVSEPAL